MSDKVKLEAKPLEIRPSPASPSAKMKLAPKLELKPSARGGLLDGPGQIVTSKEWVLPPRPKPGRKPSSDTPPSKRKAQNRAAQRAFRERRAQRVSELEDKLQEVETERDAQENVLKDALKDVSSENQLLRESLEALRREVMSIKEQRTPTGTTPQQSPQYPPNNPPPANHLPRPYYSQYMPAYSPHQVTSPMTMEPTSPYHRNSFGSFSFQSYGAYSPRYESNPASPSEHTTTATSVGDATLETLDRVLDTKMVRRDSHVSVGQVTGHMSHVTPSIPISSLTEKGPVGASGSVPSVASAAGNVSGPSGGVSGASGAVSGGVPGVGGCGSVPRVAPSVTDQSVATGTASHVVDPDCIICTKEECACAAIGQQKAVMGTNDDDDFASFKPLPAVPLKRSLEMEMDFTSSFKTRHPFKKRKDSCGFCSDGTPCLCDDVEKKNLKLPPLGMPLSPAASATSPDASQSGIGSPWDDRDKRVSDTPGCTGNPGTCMQCQSDPMSTLFCTTVASRKQSATRSTLPEVEREPKYSPSTQVGGTYIPCSAAYQTLSRHKDFDRVDLGTLIGKLNTKGTQVEVSSVANVLRELDRKFYE